MSFATRYTVAVPSLLWKLSAAVNVPRAKTAAGTGLVGMGSVALVPVLEA